MNPHNDSMSALHNEISQWEHAINCYNGPDPLDLWFRYICWLESNSSQGLEEKFRKSVEQCLSTYDKYENYKQDLRMVKLWIKYIDFQPNPLNLYKILYQQGIGTRCASFYIGWAHYYNSANHFKQAESIFNLGLQLKAVPLHELETAQKNFRFSVAQRMLYNDESSKKRTISSLAEQRQQITSLSPHQNTAKRIKSETYCAANVQENGLQNGAKTQPYPATQEYEQHYPSSDPAYAISSSLNYVYDDSSAYNQVEEQTQPVVYTFECGFQMPANFVNFSNNSHEAWNAPLFLEEPYDPNRRCFYPKHQVYPGDGTEYSLEELKAHKWRMRMEEKRRQEELRIERENEEKRRREEQEALRRRQEEEQRYRQSQIYQQQQQQQRWSYHSPASYGSYYQGYENSPQYSYVHDHQYQTHYAQSTQMYQHSPQNYQNSPNYHQSMQQSVIVNRSQYENHQYYMNYPTHSPVQQQSQSFMENNYHHVQQPMQQQPMPQQQYVQQPEVHSKNTQQRTQFDDYQDVEYLIDHQAEIDPKMLKQPIVESVNNTDSEEKLDEEEGSEYSDSDNSCDSEEEIPPIVNSYMLDDLEEQIEASTISFSSNGKSRDKKITIKFRKEKTTTTILNSESSESSSAHVKTSKVPLETKSSETSSYASDKKKKKKHEKRFVEPFDGENTQFMPSAANSCSSTTNGELQSFSKINFNGCVTPLRKQAASKTSTPISSYKFLKNQGSFVSNQNDDSICSFTGDQNSFFQAENDDDFKSRRLEKALATIDEHMKKRDVDPFSSELCRAFLTKLNFPNRENKIDYKVISSNLPKICKNQTVPINDTSYQIEKEVGKGSFGSVYRGVNLSDGSVVALKYQRPSNMATWELYICTEVKNRIKNADILPGFMTISAAVVAPNASVLISEFSQYGSLLDINNRIRQATTKVMHESLVMHFSSQIMSIVSHLHDCKIIHADIKPDNFLLMTLPSADTHIPSLRLIDFGCAIDMTLFKQGQEFRKIIETDGFTCVEMQEGRLWSYQTDLFCLAGTIHVMLFGEYMQVNKKFGVWDIKQKFPRYLNKTLWTDVFSKLLNIKDSQHLPNLKQMKAYIDRETNDKELVKQISTVSNLIRKR